MRFTLSSAELKEQLQLVNGALGSNPVLPILEDFLFQLEDGRLRITATDLETFVQAELEVNAEEEGAVAVPAKILLDTLKQLPTQPLSFQVDPNNFAITITSAFGQYQLAGEDGDDYPKLPQADSAEEIEMPALLLLEGINKTLFAASNDELRPAMTGVLLEINPQGVTFVSTDAHKLVKYSFTEIEPTTDTSLILPKKALNLLKNGLSDHNGNVRIAFSRSNAFFYYANQIIICRLIDARYPDYNSVIPQNNSKTMRVVRQDFLNSLKRIANYANKVTNQVKLTISEEHLKIEAEDIDFSNKASEKMPCYYEGETLSIGFNAKFLVEMLNVIGGDNVLLHLESPNRAGLLRQEEENPGEDLLMLVMPVILNY
ncbi:DNA polymerase III subunit beta [Saprospira grandis]|uniref:DNA polymerase III subunit beta n=1 Tax=Saprospira grandis TaxID=1008 RepID=UPI0022DCFCFF|nr:DNA polymerase III subunit beta [Saprospira grandis]WBM76041.1 DNA polymerase III subunit beta [Saprospira grandis]